MITRLKCSKRKMSKISKWVHYLVGFSGCGPTALDREPKVKLTNRERFKYHIDEIVKQIQSEKYPLWKKHCADVLGTDDDWDEGIFSKGEIK